MPQKICFIVQEYQYRTDIHFCVAGILGTGAKKIEPCLYDDVSKIGRLGNDLLINTKTKDLPDWRKSLAGYLRSKYGGV